MKFLLPHKSMMWQYGLSFLLVLIIPLMGICSYFVVTLNHTVEERSMSERKKQATEISTSLTKEFDGIISSAYRLSTSFGVSRYKMKNLTKYGQSIITTLNDARLESNLIDAIYLYHPQEKYAYSSTSSYTQDRLWAEFHPGEVVDHKKLQQFRDMLAQLDVCPKLVVGTKSIYLYFPYPVSEIQSRTHLIYRIDIETIYKTLQELAKNPQMTVALHTPSGDAVAIAGALNQSELNNLKNSISIQDPKDLYSVRKSGGESYTWYQSELSSVQMYCTLIASEDEFVSIVRDSQLQMTIVILLVLVCGGVLALLFAYAAYHPVRRLKSSADALSIDIGSNEQNEFTAIQAVMEKLHTSVVNLENFSAVNQKAIKQHLVLRLIHGLISDDISYRDSFRHLGIFTEDGYCFVAVCYFTEKKKGGMQIDVLADYLESESNEDVTICTAIGPQRDQVTLVCTTDNEDISSLIPFFTKLRSEIIKQFDIEITIGIGLSYSNLNYLSTSYIQATNAYIHRSIVEKTDVLLFTTESLSYGMDIQYRNLLTLLSNAIQNCNQEEITSSLQFILDFAYRNGITVQNAHMLCFSIIELTSTVFYSFKYDRQPEFNCKYNLTTITNVDSAEKFQNFIHDISTDICSIVSLDAHLQVDGEGDESCQSLIAKMQEYLDTNIMNHQFSVAGMATDFSLSTSYISRIYKEHTKETILEYVNRKRIERVKVLLLETDETLETIVAAVGYFDVSSFIRKFKRTVGVTPGEYRNISKNK